MKQQNKLKILNDPIYGFISIPNDAIFELIEHPYFQRLRRITQMGLSYLVYPGAHHTRFHHAIGCLHLMQRAVQVLRSKGIVIDDVEEDALYKAILLHDLGHGPFSHALENLIIQGISHEEISLLFMQDLNAQFNGSLTLAIKIFQGKYHRPFMLDLISSQLDMDRLDYLKRDSFYTGVAEGNINSQRLISMLNVVDDRLVVEEKALYSVENFLSGRRLMYWQVYLHKTGIGAEHLLQSVVQRVHELLDNGVTVDIPTTLQFFLSNKTIDRSQLLERFAAIDDTDIFTLLKSNQSHSDLVLRELCQMILNRQLLRIKFSNTPVPQKKLDKKIEKLKKSYKLNDKEASYFIFHGEISNSAYAKAKPILILNKKNKVVELTDAAKEPSFKALAKVVTKYYYCYPKIQD
ncbi:HD domain-containing protein [Nonlabens marinus]|uniref:Deoxyguanosinetriphosphate triphosphohydrolase n=1 Tax=Nonlabens marinus S1-08 TaxID=1454201 RepID=W8VRG8_9FLAO|nr:HD domain-containing protein [Nonlabens marinus]BAO56244.1 deoxyguanosinetriphosphate triphosphohydrolase [Nonlabens marinus S1-08]